MSKEQYTLDPVDVQILQELQKNGRVSYRTIADKLDISDGTVRFRVNRMLEANLLKFSALINPFYFQNSILALIGMELESRTHQETMKKIAALEGVISVCNTAGQYDLFVEVFLPSRDDLNRFLFEELPHIEGIKSTYTYVYLDARDKWIEAKL